MLNSLRDGQINYGTTNFPSVHVPPHNVVTPIHQNSLISTEPATSVYPWNTNPRFEHLYGFHSRYYNLDFPTPYPPTTNQYVSPNMYGQNLPQCCQPCCRLRSQNIPKTSPSQMLYNPIRPVQQLNRPYKSKKTLKTPCSDQFLPYIPNDFPVKYDTQNCYQQKYNSSYVNNTNYCPPANNLWIPPAANTAWSTDRLQSLSHHTNIASHDFSRNKNYQRLPNYQNNLYSNPTSTRPYNYIPPISTNVHDYRSSSVNYNSSKNNTSEYISHESNSRIPVSSQNNQSPPSLQHYYNAQSMVPYPDLKKHSESFKPPHVTSQNSSKSDLNVREFLANWDEGEEEISEKSTDDPAPIVVLDCMTVEGDALTKIQEKLNVISYENLEKVLKENQNQSIINTEPIIEIDSIHNKARLPSKPNFEPLDYTKRETGIIKPFINEKKTLSETDGQSEKSYSVNFDGMVAWYGKKNTDISSTDLIERLADRIFNLSKSQENEEVSFGTAAYTGQITQTNRSITSSIKDSSKYIQSQQLFGLQNHTEKCTEPSVINKISCNNDIPRIYSGVLNENDKSSDIKSNNLNSSCIVENITKKYLNVTNEQTAPWNLEQATQEQHLNLSLYDHSVIIKPLDFSSLTDESKCNPFAFEKNTSNSDKLNDCINNQFSKDLSQNNNYNTTVSINQHSVQQIDSGNRNFPVIVSPHNNRQNYNVFHESVIQRTGCDKNKQDKVSTNTDFDSINWNMSSDFDKIIKNTNISMEPSSLYDRNNYNILDSINVDKNVSTQWKNNIPCIDLTVNSKTNSGHDTFFDGWNFIESYDNNLNKKIVHLPSNNNEAHNSLYTNQITILGESNNKNNLADKDETELVTVKDISFSKINDMPSNNIRSRDVFNLNNRIPDFSDGFELPVINETHDYMQFKKSSNDSENRTDGSIFEHLTESKYVRTINDSITVKTDQHKPDIIGLPSFKDKEPLAPMPVPPKLNIVKPIIRDPSQIYTVIKQKLKCDNACNINNNMVLNKTKNSLSENETNNFNVTDLKSKYNNVQLNQFDVWSEKFILKGNSKNLLSPTVQCDVEITQFKSTPENRNTLISKLNTCENYQGKNTKLPENIDCNLSADKNNIENVKINSNDFLNCLNSTKTNDQKYRDTLDEFETSFGFDIHCNNESNKSFHEEIVDKCLEERVKDQIDGHNINGSNSNENITSSDNTHLPFHCDFQSNYLIKSYFDENKNKTAVLDENQLSNNKKSDTPTHFNFELHNIHSTQNSKENENFNILNNTNNHNEKIQNNNSNMNKTKLNQLFVSNNNNINKMSSIEKNNFEYVTMENRNFEFENNKNCISELTNTKELKDINKTHNSSKISNNSYSNTPKSTCNNFELNINNINMFETNSNKIKTRNNGLEHNKNNIGTIYQSVNEENIKHNKDVFELENNNGDLKNLDKIHEFDFHNRNIPNFEYSQNHIDKLISPTKVFTNDNQVKVDYNYDINNKDIQFENTSYIKPQTEKVSILDRNDIRQHHNIIEINNVIPDNKIDLEADFKVNCIENNESSKINKNCNTHENSNTNINYEVENIFENLYDNLKTLNTQKDNSNNYFQSDISNNLRNIEDQNLKVNNFVVDKNNKKTDIDDCQKSDKIFEKANTTLLQEFVNNSVSHLSSFSLRLCKPLMEESCEKLSAGNSEELNEYISNKNENIFNISNNSKVHQSTTIFKEQGSDDIKQIGIESINQNNTNMQSIKCNEYNTIKDKKITKKKFENIKTDLLNAVKNTITIQDEKNGGQNNSSELSSVNHTKLIYKHTSDIIEIKDSPKSEIRPGKFVELLHRLNSNSIVEIKNLSNVFVSPSPNELTHHQNHNEINTIKDTSISEPSSLNQVKLICQQNSNETIEIEDSHNFESDLINHGASQHHCSESVEIEDSHKIEPILRSNGESRNHNEMDANNDYSIFERNSVNQTKLQNLNETIEAVNSPKFELGQISTSKITEQRHGRKTNEIEDSTKIEPILINHGESINQQNFNEINAIKDFSISECNSVNQTKLQNLNKTIEVVNSPKFELSLISHSKITEQRHGNEMNEIEDLPKIEPILMNHDELIDQHNYNEIDVIKDSSISERNSVNQTTLQNSKEMIEFENLPEFEPNVIVNCSKLTQQHFSETIEVENSAKVEPLLNSRSVLTYQQNHNEMDAFKKNFESESNSIIQVKQIDQEHFNETVKVEDTNSIFELIKPGMLRNGELTNLQNYNSMVEVEDSPKTGQILLNHSESTDKNNCNEIIEDSHIPESNLLINSELPHKRSINMIEIENMPKSDSSSLNHVELISKRNYNNDNGRNEYLTILNSVSSSDVLSTRQPNKDETLTELFENNIDKSNEDFLKNNSKDVENIKLPRVKFLLKCHNKNILKTNVFDKDPVVLSKSLNVTKDIHLIDRDYCKNRNSFYKPWRKKFYEKKLIDKPKGNEVEVVEVACPVINIESYKFPQNIESSDFDSGKKYDDNNASLANIIYSDKEEQYIEQGNNIVDDEIYENISNSSIIYDSYEKCVRKENTPMPSPYNDFESVSQSCEHHVEEFWDKSLENEYKNVLRKTISNLVKNRVNIRDKFDTRLLARKVNQIKRRKWHQRRRKFVKTALARPQIHDLIAIENMELTKLSRTDPMRCMIKVQLPWGRIFNLNDQNRLEDSQGYVKDTKIELGPAKVEVRLSQTPGEWQVAACQSVTSSKSVVSVKRLVLQRETIGDAVNVYDEYHSAISHSSDTSSNCAQRKYSRKLPKIVIRRNGRNNNYTSYVSSSGIDEGGDIVNKFPRLVVRLVRDENLDAMAADGVTKVHLKHIVPTSAAESVADTHDAKRIRYA